MSLSINIVANYLGHAVTALSSIVFIPFYLRYLGVEAYGLIGIFAVFQAAMSLLDLGMAPTLNREVARHSAGAITDRELVSIVVTIERIVLVLATLASSAVVLSADWLALHWLDKSGLSARDIADALGLIGVVSAFRVLESVYRAILLGFQFQVRLNILSGSLTLFRYLGALAVLAFVSPTILAFFWWQLFATLVTILATGWFARHELPGVASEAKFSFKSLKSCWAFSGGAMLAAVLSLCLTQGDKMILSSLLPLETFSAYSLATSLVGIVPLMVWPVTQALYPRLSELVAARRTDALIDVYHKGCQCVSVVVGPVAAALVFYGRDLIEVWTGHPGLLPDVGLLVALLGIGAALNAIMHLPYMLQLAYGRTSLAAYANAVAVALLLPALVLIVPAFGPVGAATVWVTLNSAYVLIIVAIMHRSIITSEMREWYMRDFLLPVVAAFAAVGSLSLFFNHQMSSIATLAWIAASILIGMLFALFAAGRLRMVATEIVSRKLRTLEGN